MFDYLLENRRLCKRGAVMKTFSWPFSCLLFRQQEVPRSMLRPSQ